MSRSQNRLSKRDQPKTGSRSQARSNTTVTIVLLLLLVGASGAAAYYYNQRAVQTNRASDLSSQVADLNAKIQSLNQKIASMGDQCVPDQGYSTCNEEILALSSQITNLTSQRNNLTDIVNLRKSQVIASSVGLTWQGCGDTGQPSCTNQSPLISAPQLNFFAIQCTGGSSCYAGYLDINWTATQTIHLYFQFVTGTGTASTTSNSGTTGSTIIPYPGGSMLTNGDFMGSFQNDGCVYDTLNNPIRCPGGSLTYNAVYKY